MSAHTFAIKTRALAQSTSRRQTAGATQSVEWRFDKANRAAQIFSDIIRSIRTRRSQSVASVAVRSAKADELLARAHAYARLTPPLVCSLKAANDNLARRRAHNLDDELARSAAARRQQSEEG